LVNIAVKQRRGTLLTAVLLVTVACDPGMTISQASSPETAKGAGIALNVKTSHPLIGETKYAPEIQIRNSSEAAITVTGVELAAGRFTYTNKPLRSGSYPLIVPPGETDVLDIWFDLHDDVKTTFRQSAELRVHYRRSDKEETAQTNIIGSPLNADAR
jgi:hypothetical protein